MKSRSSRLCENRQRDYAEHHYAPIESFWSRMKAELSEHLHLRTIEYATVVITDYIHNYYTVRQYSAIGFIPPMELEYNNNLLVFT